MNIITHTLTSPDRWYQSLQRSIPAVTRGNRLIIDPEFGQGQLQYLKIQDGLWAQQMEFLLNDDLEIQRKPTRSNDHFLLDFYLSDSQVEVRSENKRHSVSFKNISLILTSSTTSARTYIPSAQPLKIFNILFSREWLLQNVGTDHPGLHDFFSTNNPVYLAEMLDSRLTGLATGIDFDHNRLTTISRVMQILDYLFSKFSTRNFDRPPVRVYPQDMERLLEARQYLADHPTEKIRIADLAERSGMSISKFKRLFLQVVGTTPYQYHLENKMNKAMEILRSGAYSVSETGHLIGYINLSQFSSAFKKYFGMLPSKVVRG